MNTFLLTTLAGLAATIGGAAGISGSPSPARTAAVFDYRPELLPSDASLVVHLDVASFRRSTFGALFMQSRDQFDFEDLDEMVEELGFDPIEALNSITLYGVGEDPEPKTAVILASSAIDTALHRAAEEDSFRHLKVDGIELFQFEKAYGYIEVDGADRILVLAEDLDAVVRGARVVRGEGPSLRDATSSTSDLQPRAGSFFFVYSADGIAGASEFRPASQILNLAESIRLDVGEADGSIFAELGIATGDPARASDVYDIVNGFLAITRLLGLADGAPDLGDLLGALTVNRRGGTVMLEFEYSVDSLAHLVLSALAEEN